jgi:ActR/RegA family two-component response regulator
MEARAKVLLVDDERLVLRSLQKTLIRAGFDVETAGNCADGLAIFQVARSTKAPFDLAVVDLNMPGFDGAPAPGAGLELLSQLIAQQPDFPVVVLTAYDEVKKAKEAVNRGARSYFVKGREQGLVQLINDILASLHVEE